MIQVISDLHILSSKDPIYRTLLTLLLESKTRTWVLAGDIFDVLVGKAEYFSEEYREFFEALHRITQNGVRVVYIEGNHDFNLSPLFLALSPRVEIAAEEFETEADGRRFYFAHGDLVDLEDKGYLRLRKIYRSLPVRVLTRLLTGRSVQAIGHRLSSWSRNSHWRLPEDWPAEELNRLRKKFRTFAERKFYEGVDFVIMGHCHDLDEWTKEINGVNRSYLNVGFPKKHRSYICWDGSRIQRVPF